MHRERHLIGVFYLWFNYCFHLICVQEITSILRLITACNTWRWFLLLLTMVEKNNMSIIQYAIARIILHFMQALDWFCWTFESINMHFFCVHSCIKILHTHKRLGLWRYNPRRLALFITQKPNILLLVWEGFISLEIWSIIAFYGRFIGWNWLKTRYILVLR